MAKRTPKTAPKRSGTIEYSVKATTVDVYCAGPDADWRLRARDASGSIIARGKGYTRSWSAKRGAERAFPGATITVAP